MRRSCIYYILGGGNPVVNTWNSFLVITEDERILIPAYGFRKTEKNVNVNNNILLTLGTKKFRATKIILAPAFLLKEQPDTLALVKSMI